MQNILSIRLNKNKACPVFLQKVNDNQLVFMMDTGANIPVWCSGIAKLKYVYKNCKDTGFFADLNGFGGKGERCKIFEIPHFALTDNKTVLYYDKIFVAVTERRIFQYDLILSNTMFYKMNLSLLNMKNHSVNPTLEIEFDKKLYYTAMTYETDYRRILNGEEPENLYGHLYSFTNDEKR